MYNSCGHTVTDIFIVISKIFSFVAFEGVYCNNVSQGERGSCPKELNNLKFDHGQDTKEMENMFDIVNVKCQCVIVV